MLDYKFKRFIFNKMLSDFKNKLLYLLHDKD